jgi:hypothetical protein
METEARGAFLFNPQWEFTMKSALCRPYPVRVTMPSKQELEGLPLTGLAVLCKKVADNPEKYTEAGAAVAAKLRDQWFLLLERFNPSLKEQQEGERKQAELKKRMAEFLENML